MVLGVTPYELTYPFWLCYRPRSVTRAFFIVVGHIHCTQRTATHLMKMYSARTGGRTRRRYGRFLIGSEPDHNDTRHRPPVETLGNH